MKRHSVFRSLGLIALGLLIPAAASQAADRIAGRGYEAITSKSPPDDAAAPNVRWHHAVLWTLLSGAFAGLMSLFARRALSSAGLPAGGESLGSDLRRLFGRR